MKFLFTYFLFVVSAIFLPDVSNAQSAGEASEFSSLLSLFSAYTTSHGSVRINWSLDSLSPTITKFRIYRGYEDAGSFAILAEIDPHSSSNDYSYSDTSIHQEVTYYYKIAALGQKNESIFPVVISATPGAQQSKKEGTQDLAPVVILNAEKLSLYVRRAGRVRLELMAAKPVMLVDDNLRPGIFEFELPTGFSVPVKLALHADGYDKETVWPVP